MNDSAGPDTSSLLGKGDVTVVELDRRERAISRRSAEIRAVVPDVVFAAEVDMAASSALAAELQCGTTALLIRACAHALSSVRRANGAYRDGHLELYSRINIGVTIAEDSAYEVPTIFDADRKTAPEIGLELAALADRAREGLLTAPEMSGATFTVTDSSVFQIATLTPLIVTPQAAALAAGPIRDVPVVRDGQVVPGQTMVLTLAADHRILYGAHAAAFLGEIRAHLEQAAP